MSLHLASLVRAASSIVMRGGLPSTSAKFQKSKAILSFSLSAHYSFLPRRFVPENKAESQCQLL